MLHIIVGVMAILIGLWGVARNWYMFIDILVAILPLALIAFGIVAFLAGIRKLKSE